MPSITTTGYNVFTLLATYQQAIAFCGTEAQEWLGKLTTLSVNTFVQLFINMDNTT